MPAHPRRPSKREKRPEGPDSALRQVSGVEEALGLALTALGSHERTVSELEGWLEKRGIDTEARREVLERLIEDGTLDDARFARCFAEDKREISGWGAERIRDSLRRRGVHSYDVEAALGQETASEELERAVALVLGRAFELGDERDRARALGLLARRGYEADLAYEALRRAERAAAAR